MPITDLRSRGGGQERTLGDALSDFAKVFQTQEKSEDAMRVFYTENPEAARQIVKADVWRGLDLQAGKGMAPGDVTKAEDVGRVGGAGGLGDAKTPTSELYLPQVLTAGRMPGSEGKAVPLSLINELKSQFPDEVLKAQKEWQVNQEFTPTRVAESEITELRGEEARVGMESRLKIRASEVQRIVEERFPADEEARGLYLKLMNDVESEEQRGMQQRIDREFLEDAADFIEARDPFERKLIAAEKQGLSTLTQYWLAQKQFEMNAWLSSMASAQTPMKRLKERSELEAAYQGRIKGLKEDLELELEEGGKNEEEINAILNAIQAAMSELMFVNPALGFSTMTKMEKWGQGKLKDVEFQFQWITPALSDQMDGLALELSNDTSWEPQKYANDPLNDPLIQSLSRRMPWLSDPITGTTYEHYLREVMTRAWNMRNGESQRGRTLQDAAREAIVLGKMTQGHLDELRQAEAKLKGLRDGGRHGEAARFEEAVTRLRIRNWFLTGQDFRALKIAPPKGV